MVLFYASPNEALRTHQNRALDGVRGSLLQRSPNLCNCDIAPMLPNMIAYCSFWGRGRDFEAPQPDSLHSVLSEDMLEPIDQK
jgi:hypothetical protein